MLLPVWFENEIAIDDNTYRKSRTDGQRRLNIQTAPDDLLAGLVQRVPCPAPQCLDDCTVVAVGVGARAEFGADSPALFDDFRSVSWQVEPRKPAIDGVWRKA